MKRIWNQIRQAEPLVLAMLSVLVSYSAIAVMFELAGAYVVSLVAVFLTSAYLLGLAVVMLTERMRSQ